MSRLEVAAQRVLTPLILGATATITQADQATIAMWVQKTALTAMLISSKEQRRSGYGLSATEYTAMYEQRDLMQPLEASQFWVGRYEGPAGFWAVRVTPLTVRLAGLAEPDVPQCYLMTIVLGRLALQGLRFTTPVLEIVATNGLGMPRLWPSQASVSAPAGQPCTEMSFLRFADGRFLKSTVDHVEIGPWAYATELPQSAIVEGRVKVPALCRKHFYYYPAAILEEALRGRFYAFMTACECQTAYLVQTEPDGAHCKAAGALDGIEQMYEDLPGDEFLIQDEVGEFICKRVSST
ncbi:hypothetical protein [Cellulosimicrobium cellulans]|uniref:hypothetical protein n=1 Tax=Cellulosimicrobium cellulans TaxID=1710 RepID=UPI001EDA5BA9|nr:hypothetical protein [Cellulosimicrobium cellulans]